MALFSEGTAPAIGPVRSARGSTSSPGRPEWNAIYTHVGGSPQALALLNSSQGRGKVVYNADEFRWGGRYLYRIKTRFAPHNVYTDAEAPRRAREAARRQPLVEYKAHWQFAADALLDQRPVGASIAFAYPQNAIKYTYDRTTNTYLRSVSVEGKQVDAGTKLRIAPKNVVIMLVSFAPLNDGSHKHRLEASTSAAARPGSPPTARSSRARGRRQS